MKTLVFDKAEGAWNDTKGMWLSDAEKPELTPDETDHVIVKMKYAGFCGSDRGIWSRAAFGDMILGSMEKEDKSKRIIGHELLGEIVETGSGVEKEYELRVGDIVSAESHIACGTCYQCERGNFHVCADDIIIGISQDGCFAEYAKLPAKILWKTNIEKIDPRVASIQEPFGNAVHSCTQVPMKEKTVAVFGCGAIGSLCIIIAKGMGAKKIIGVDVSEKSLALAKKVGADEVIQIDTAAEKEHSWEYDKNVVERIREITDGVGVDVALEMAGFNSSVNNAIQSTCRGGDVVLFGLKTGDAHIQHFDKIIRDGITMHSVIGRRLWSTWETTKQLLEDKENSVQEKIIKYILEDFNGSVVPFADFDRDMFEEKLRAHPKLIFEF